jgi:hypothetical protein
LQEGEVRELVARPLEEEHRNPDRGQMHATFVGRLSRRMQRESQKHEAAHAGQRRHRLRLRRHAAAERFAAREQRHSRQERRCRRDGGTNGGMRDLGSVHALAAAFHVREVVAQRGDAPLGEVVGKGGQERLLHPRTRPVCHHVARLRLRGHFEQPRNG